MNVLFLLRQSPYGSTLAREALDMALAFAAFDQQVQLVFMGDGVLQLLPSQHAHLVHKKNIEKTLDALELYEINRIYADAHSLALRGLTEKDIRSDVTTVSSEQLQQLLRNADQVFHL